MLYCVEPDSGQVSTYKPFTSEDSRRVMSAARLAGYQHPPRVRPLVGVVLAEPDDAEGRAAAPVASEFGLPSLSRNNSNGRKNPLNEFQPGHKKTSWLLHLGIVTLCNRVGVERVGFLTLTFKGGADRVKYKNAKTAAGALNCLMTGFLRELFPDYICVMERHEDGVLHYHLVVAVEQDIKTGFDFAEVKARNYRSASPYLRSLWAQLREKLPAYGFGRAELHPVKSTAEGISRYVGEYVSKHVCNRTLEDKGLRIVRFSRVSRVGTCNFAWNSPRAWLWRAKVSAWARKNGCDSLEALNEVYGENWAFLFKREILAVKLHFWPNREIALADGQTWVREFPDDGAPVHADPFRPYVDVQRGLDIAAAKLTLRQGIDSTAAQVPCPGARAVVERILARGAPAESSQVELVPAEPAPGTRKYALRTWGNVLESKYQAAVAARLSADCPF